MGLRAETRAALKSEQNSIAAIDEQLWLTDQRLGQRIDELAHAQERTAVMVQVNETRPLSKARESSSSPSQVVVDEVRVTSDVWDTGESRRTLRRPVANVVHMPASSRSPSPRAASN